jgi:autotransporter-associated beta strand protein
VYSASTGGFYQYNAVDGNRTGLGANGSASLMNAQIGSSSFNGGSGGSTSPRVFGWTKTASTGSGSLYADGSVVATNSFSGTPQNSGFSLGGTLGGINLISGRYGETIVTGSTNLVASDRQLVEGYLAWKWGQTANLNAANPYKTAVPRAATNTVYLGGNQTAAGLVFSGSASATTLLGGTSGSLAANTLAIGAGGISISALAGDAILGAASGGTVGIVLNASQSWTNNSAAVLRAFNGVSRATGDTTSRLLTIAGSGSTQIDGAIADGGVSGALALLKQDAGSLLLGGLNTFTGSTTITGGTLALAAGGGLASPAISVGTGAALDLSALSAGLTLGSGQSIGGLGSIVGNVVFGAGSQFAFSSGALQQLVLASGSASFASAFGVASVLGDPSPVSVPALMRELGNSPRGVSEGGA